MSRKQKQIHGVKKRLNKENHQIPPRNVLQENPFNCSLHGMQLSSHEIFSMNSSFNLPKENFRTLYQHRCRSREVGKMSAFRVTLVKKTSCETLGAVTGV